MTVNHDVAGSNPASGASGLFVKRLRHRPFTAGSGVRIPHRSPWAISSAGRASALQAECQQFDPVIAHQKKTSCDLLHAVFFLAFSLFSLRSYNLLHPRLTTFCASLRSFKMCSLRNQFDPVFAHHNEKFHVLRAVGFFIAISLFSLQSYNLLHPRLTTFCASLCSFKMCSLRNQFDPVIAHPPKNLLHLTPKRGIIRKHMGH